jgi:hypothetical protein
VRSPRIRRREEIETMRLEHIAHGDLTALKDKAEREGLEVVRLEAVASGDRKARGVKDKKEDERWDLLNERMRIQEAAGLQNQEDRETARQTLATGDAKAQHVKDLKEDERWKQLNERLLQQDQTSLENREVDQQERADDRSSAGDRSSPSSVTNQSRAEDYRFAKAQLVKDAKEDSRWDLLNESLRLQKETVEQASEERILVAQQVKDIKDEGEVMRKGLASDDLEARHVKESKEEKRWTALYERLHIQDMRAEEREQRDVRRDQEQIRMRREDDVKDTYRSLFARYIRNNSNTTQGRAVADGLAPIPTDWLEAQPELQKDPSLLLLLVAFNQR